MGLDIYFSRVNKLDYSLNKETAIDDEIQVGYFRKVNCLLPFFGYEEAGEHLEIAKCQIEDLLDIAKELLKNYATFRQKLFELNTEYHNETKEKEKQLVKYKLDVLWKPFEELAEKKLPTTSGFFFGSIEYRDWYIEDLMDIVEIFEVALEDIDFDTEQVLMYCSW
jgi:hypothetical protein